MKKSIWIILIVLLVGVFLFAAWQVVDIWREYWKGEQFYAQLNQLVSTPEPEKKPLLWVKENEAEEETQPEKTEEEDIWPEVDFDALQAINPDVIGWLYIPDTNVNYPILQGASNDQYIYHLMTGEYNSAGSLFLESGIPSDFSEQNSPIYGHNMKNGTMFAGITGYKGQEFYDAHQVALLLTPDARYYIQIFSAYVTDVWDDAWQTTFSLSDYQKWLDQRERKSYFTPVLTPTTDDRVVTFSTCTYETANARFVVHGILKPYENTAY